MNDRYLYKAKRVDNKEWVTGNLIVNNRDDEVYIGAYEPNESAIGLEWNIYIVDINTLCQCTGLKDKNGKLIWENDILIVGYYKWKSKVVWDNECARFIGYTNDKEPRVVYVDAVDKNDKSAVEVIGSVIDNPELLEV